MGILLARTDGADELAGVEILPVLADLEVAVVARGVSSHTDSADSLSLRDLIADGDIVGAVVRIEGLGAVRVLDDDVASVSPGGVPE